MVIATVGVPTPSKSYCAETPKHLFDVNTPFVFVVKSIEVDLF